MSAVQKQGREQRQSHGRLTLLLLPVAIACLILAALAGLVRMGWAWPMPRQLTLLHGPVVICGFLGTVIGVERAVALAQSWAYAAPIAAAAGTLLLLTGLAPVVGTGALVAAGIGLVAVYVVAYRRQPSSFTAVMGLGAVCWLVANVLYASETLSFIVAYWWMAFLVLTITGERLELSRMRPPSRHRQTVFLVLVVGYLAALVLALLDAGIGARLLGVTTLGLALWLWQNDIAIVTIRFQGLTRFIAAGLLSGYVWLTIGGVLFIIFGDVPAGLIYDAQLHAVFVGFVFSMIFAHAPIILPAVTGIRVAYHPRFYAHLFLLHASLIVRVTGDLITSPPLRAWGGLLNLAAIVLFLLNTVRAARDAKRADAPQTA